MIAALIAWLPSLLLTLAIELAVVAAIVRGDDRKAALRVCAAVNLLTHPLATLLSWRWSVDVVALECLVFFFEWLAYSQLLPRRGLLALRLAFSTNLLSCLAGVALWLLRLA